MDTLKLIGYNKHKDIIERMSERWNIPQELICAIIWQESRFISDVKRFEPLFLKKYIKPMNLPEDEEKWRATSWGLMQIMGQTSRENGYRDIRSNLTDPITNIYYSLKFFTRLLKRYKGKKEDAIAAYNQGSNRFKDENQNGIKDSNELYYNQHYVDSVLKWEKEFIEVIHDTNKVVSDTSQSYTVKAGDTLNKISNIYDISIENIIKLNNIKNANLIYPGQIIKLK